MGNKETSEDKAFDNGLSEFVIYKKLYKNANKFDFVNGYFAGALTMQEKVEKLRNKLYNELPTGEVNAFDLLKIIKNHISELDKLN